MTTHDLKILPEPFAAVLSGAKTYEIRRDDRGFAVGDRLRLQEWIPGAPRTRHCEIYEDAYAPAFYTGRETLVEITHKTPGGAWGLPEGLCVLAIRRVEP